MYFLHPVYQTQSISKNLHFLHPVFQTHSIYELLYFLHPVFLNHCFLLGSISSPLYYLCTVFLLRFFVLAWKTNSAPLKFEHWVCWRLCGWLTEINLRILEFQLFFHPDQFNLSSKYWNFWSKVRGFPLCLLFSGPINRCIFAMISGHCGEIVGLSTAWAWTLTISHYAIQGWEHLQGFTRPDFLLDITNNGND